MSLATLLNQPVTIEHVGDGALDAYGVAAQSISDTVTVDGFLEPFLETEQLVEAQTYTTSWRLFLPAGTVIAAHDLVAVNGVTYEIHEVLPFTNPRTQLLHHFECRVVEIEG